jgi:hypothetical protein
MRLLEIHEHGFKPSPNYEECDIPQYAILSHTWGADGDEVTLKDITNGGCTQKKGYHKLELCADQARQDGYRYLWADTCCIDKTDSVELNTTITSMFRWYQHAAKCYVYLSDVAIAEPDTNGSSNSNRTWHSSFRSCRWLTRGWTLQELLAPQIVEFYDSMGKKLGDKASLEKEICQVTGIPAKALRGAPLSSFTIEERLSWQRARHTKKPEDKAYSLAGICNVSIIPIYGEGLDRAMGRLQKEIDETFKGEYDTIPRSFYC